MRRKRNPKVLRHISAEDEEEVLLPGTLFGKNEIPLSGSMDKLSVQFGLTFITYFIAYTITSILSKLCDMSGVNLLTSTVKPLFWGFNFIFATLGGIFVRKFLGSLYRSGAIKKRYTNNMMLDRVSGLMFDLMIVASIGAINLSAFRHGEFVIPMIVMCLVAAVASYFYVDHVCRKLFPDYNDESFLALYGMLTGVVGTGVILLREIDPRFETPACKNLVFQTLWTCLMGFPLLLFMGFVARSTTWTVITLSVNIVMFVFFYSIIRMNSRKIARERGETAGKSPPSQ
jgi:ESS family glutamate:Na+ symporter